MDKSGFKPSVLILLLLLLPICVQADVEEKSSVVGSLIDTSSSPVSGVTIRLLDSYFLNEIAKTVTDTKGKFTLSNILPGLYLISIENPAKADFLKRIQVVSGSPTFLDIRPYLNDEQLKEHSAWDRFKWTIRVAQRNPLRKTDGLEPDEEENRYNSDNFWAAVRNFQQDKNIGGEISYLNVGVQPFANDRDNFHQTAQFAMQGEMLRAGSWKVNGNFLDGARSSYMAGGDVEYQLSNHGLGASFSANDLLFAQSTELEDRQRISRFIQSAEPDVITQESNRWVSTIDLEDKWQLFNKFMVNYGTRIDYYGYLQDRVSYSPRFQLGYQFSPNVAFHGMLYRSESAPGNYYLQTDLIHPFIHDVAFVPYTGTLQPESKRGLETGLDFASDDFTVSVLYHHEDINNKIATIDFRDSPRNEQLKTILPFVILNATDFQTNGMEVQASKRITHILSATASYNLTNTVPVYIIEKRVFSQRQIYFVSGRDPEEFHDFQAGIEANIPQSSTEVQASWKWSSGSSLVFGRKQDNTSLTAVDIEVHQGIPVQVFSESQLKVLVAVRNLLDQNDGKSGNADFQRALIYDSPRVFAGGVMFEF
jgi:hypothetical protein